MGVAGGTPGRTQVVLQGSRRVTQLQVSIYHPLPHGKANNFQIWPWHSWSLQVWSPPARWSTASRQTTILSTLESLKISLTVEKGTYLYLMRRQSTSRTFLTMAKPLMFSSGQMGQLFPTLPGMICSQKLV